MGPEKIQDVPDQTSRSFKLAVRPGGVDPSEGGLFFPRPATLGARFRHPFEKAPWTPPSQPSAHATSCREPTAQLLPVPRKTRVRSSTAPALNALAKNRAAVRGG